MLQESFSSSLSCVFSSHWVAYIVVLPDAEIAARMHPLQVALSVHGMIIYMLNGSWCMHHHDCPLRQSLLRRSKPFRSFPTSKAALFPVAAGIAVDRYPSSQLDLLYPRFLLLLLFPLLGGRSGRLRQWPFGDNLGCLRRKENENKLTLSALSPEDPRPALTFPSWICPSLAVALQQVCLWLGANIFETPSCCVPVLRLV